MNYHEITTKSALHKLRPGRLPYNWDLNIYRGCRHRCRYCYAMYSHDYLASGSSKKAGDQKSVEGKFFDEVFAKTNIAEVLGKELSRKSWRKEIVNLGGVTDSYQAVEERYGLTRKVLEVILKHKNPIILSTKSNVILRDLDLLSNLSKVAYVGLAITITTADENVCKKIEPHAITSAERFRVLQQLSANTNAAVGLHMMPILPFITDSAENIEVLFKNAREASVDYVLCGSLNLIGKTRKSFLTFVQQEFSEHHEKYQKIYSGEWNAKKDYREKLYQTIVNPLRMKYGFQKSGQKVMEDRMAEFGGQGRLF